MRSATNETFFVRWGTTLAAALACLLVAASAGAEPGDNRGSEFVTVRDGRFYCRDKPYYFIGTNYWYGPLLASPGATGDRQRLARELDFLAAHGMRNLRILAGAEGPDDQPSRVTPGLQQSPGKYSEELLAGLDYLLAEMAQRDMKAVLYVNNTWEWSGGYAQYLEWNGRGEIPYPMKTFWPEFMHYAAQFHDCRECIEDYLAHVRFMLSRTNQATGVKYVDDPTIMSWQIAENCDEGGPLAGCNFWTFGGTGRPSPGDPFWTKGEDILGDPPQEEQGLNAVFDVDTTIGVVDKYNRQLGAINTSN